MEGRAIVTAKTIVQKLEQFKYPALILLLGLLLILWPAKKRQTEEPTVTEQTVQAEEDIDAKMEAILSCIDGAGQVKVLLTKRTGDETVYQTDETVSTSSDAESHSKTTVMAGDSGTDVPLIRQTVFGQYRGALIVCQGADSPSVRLQLVNAVAGLTGLPTDRITVIKMKS